MHQFSKGLADPPSHFVLVSVLPTETDGTHPTVSIASHSYFKSLTERFCFFSKMWNYQIVDCFCIVAFKTNILIHPLKIVESELVSHPGGSDLLARIYKTQNSSVVYSLTNLVLLPFPLFLFLSFCLFFVFFFFFLFFFFFFLFFFSFFFFFFLCLFFFFFFSFFSFFLFFFFSFFLFLFFFTFFSFLTAVFISANRPFVIIANQWTMTDWVLTQAPFQTADSESETLPTILSTVSAPHLSSQIQPPSYTGKLKEERRKKGEIEKRMNMNLQDHQLDVQQFLYQHDHQSHHDERGVGVIFR